jgi:hypothetical protein
MFLSSDSAFSNPGLLDAFALDILGEKNKRRYGEIRLFMALSWGLGATLMGILTDKFSFNINFILYGTLATLSLTIFYFYIPEQTRAEQRIKSEQVNARALCSALSKAPILAFFAEAAIFGAGMAVVERLLFVYLIRYEALLVAFLMIKTFGCSLFLFR